MSEGSHILPWGKITLPRVRFWYRFVKLSVEIVSNTQDDDGSCNFDDAPKEIWCTQIQQYCYNQFFFFQNLDVLYLRSGTVFCVHVELCFAIHSMLFNS